LRVCAATLRRVAADWRACAAASRARDADRHGAGRVGRLVPAAGIALHWRAGHASRGSSEDVPLTKRTVAPSNAEPRERHRRPTPAGVILGLLCLMYMITYIDRLNIATAAGEIKRELALSNTQLGLVFS